MTSEIASLPGDARGPPCCPLPCARRLPSTDCILLPHPVITGSPLREPKRRSCAFFSSLFTETQAAVCLTCSSPPFREPGLLFCGLFFSQTDSTMLTSEVFLLCSCPTCIIIIFDVDQSYSLYLICYNMAPFDVLVFWPRGVGPLLPDHGWNSQLLCWKVKF